MIRLAAYSCDMDQYTFLRLEEKDRVASLRRFCRRLDSLVGEPPIAFSIV